MPPDSPSNEVLSTKLDALANIIVANQSANHESHNQIIAQTTKTNGRVTALEKTKNIMTGALLILHILVVPCLIALTLKYINSN